MQATQLRRTYGEFKIPSVDIEEQTLPQYFEDVEMLDAPSLTFRSVSATIYSPEFNTTTCAALTLIPVIHVQRIGRPL
jgi:hypothetical protein